MKKELILQRLWKTIEMMANIPEEKFHYGYWKSPNDNGCGTTHCIGGWYPSKIKGQGFYFEGNNLMKREEGEICGRDGLSGLRTYHGLREGIIQFLFLPSNWSYTLECSKKFRESWDYRSFRESFMELWGNDYFNIHVCNRIPYGEDRYEFLLAKNRGSNSKLPDLSLLFQFIYYLIDNDYITSYQNP